MDPSSPLFMILAFALISMFLVGGFALLLPTSRQLAKYLEFRMKAPPAAVDNPELQRLRAAIEGLQDELQTVSDRQNFLEKMLASRSETPTLPR